MTGRRAPGRRVVAAGLAAAVAVAGLAACDIGRQKPPRSARQSSSPSPLPTGSATGSATGGPAAAPDGTSPLGAHWDPSRTDLFERYLSTIPNTYTYYELTWCTLADQPGEPNWRRVDKAVDFANRMRIRTMLKIRVGACWATTQEGTKVRGRTSKTESQMPADLTAYRDFVTRVVTRYSPAGVHEYAIENEVNSPSYWGGTPEQLESLARTASTAIRAADPDAEVVDPGLSSTTYGYGIASRLLAAGKVDAALAAWNTYYERRSGTRGAQLAQVSSRAGLQAQLDSEQGRRNLAYLSLVTRLARDGVVDVRQVHFYEAPDAVPLLMDYVRATTPADVPVEVWEAGLFKEGGGAQVESAAQSDEMVRTVAGLLAGGARKVVWLPLAAQPDSRKGEEVRGGLLTPDGGDRAIGRVMAALVEASTGATPRPLRSSGVQGVGLSRPGRSTLVVWSDDAGGTRLDLGADAEVTEPFTGTTRTASTVRLGRSPLLVTLPTARADRLLR